MGKQGDYLKNMDPEIRREFASRGGKRSHELGRAHKWTSAEAREAGRKGGAISKRRPKQSTQLEQELAQMDKAFGLMDTIQAAYRRHFG